MYQNPTVVTQKPKQSRRQWLLNKILQTRCTQLSSESAKWWVEHGTTKGASRHISYVTSANFPSPFFIWEALEIIVTESPFIMKLLGTKEPAWIRHSKSIYLHFYSQTVGLESTVQSIGRVISTSARSETIPIPELWFTTLNTDLVLTCPELSNSANFFQKKKKSFYSDRVSDWTPNSNTSKLHHLSLLFFFFIHKITLLGCLLLLLWQLKVEKRRSNADALSFSNHHLQILFAIGEDISMAPWFFLHRHHRLYFIDLESLRMKIHP